MSKVDQKIFFLKNEQKLLNNINVKPFENTFESNSKLEEILKNNLYFTEECKTRIEESFELKQNENIFLNIKKNQSLFMTVDDSEFISDSEKQIKKKIKKNCKIIFLEKKKNLLIRNKNIFLDLNDFLYKKILRKNIKEYSCKYCKRIFHKQSALGGHVTKNHK
jgi:hypothetical protein